MCARKTAARNLEIATAELHNAAREFAADPGFHERSGLHEAAVLFDLCEQRLQEAT